MSSTFSDYPRQLFENFFAQARANGVRLLPLRPLSTNYLPTRVGQLTNLPAPGADAPDLADSPASPATAPDWEPGGAVGVAGRAGAAADSGSVSPSVSTGNVTELGVESDLASSAAANSTHDLTHRSREAITPGGPVDTRDGYSLGPGMPWTRTGPGPSARDPKLLGDFVTQLHWERNAELLAARIALDWPKIVGPNVAHNAKIVSVSEGQLVIAAQSTAWATQLRLLLPQIIRQVNDYCGTGYVSRVKVQAPPAPSWKKGRYTVPGRGPRDTYG